jgi:hypothetical protein
LFSIELIASRTSIDTRQQADLANRSMKTTLVDVLDRRGVSLVLAKRLTQKIRGAAA